MITSIRKYFDGSAAQALYKPQQLRLNDLNKLMGDRMDHKTEAAKFVAAVEAMGLIASVTEATGGSVYVNVFEPVRTKAGTIAKNRAPKHTRFKVRFANHGQVYFACVSIDPVSGATVDDALSCLRYHLTDEGEAPVVPVAMLFPQDGTVETKTATYNRRAALNGVAPLF